MSKPMNVLLILSDEHDGRLMRCAGTPWMRTPNLDALAARGTRFSRAWTPSPVCVPARASLATGRWPHEHRYWDNAMGYDGKVKGWGHDLLALGHDVESIGKLHFRNGTDPTGFSRQLKPMHIAGDGQVWGAVRDPMPLSKGPSLMLAGYGTGESEYNAYDVACVDTAIQWLKDRTASPDSKPWVLQLGLVAPHFPLVVGQQWRDLYPSEELPKFKASGENGPSHPWVARMKTFMDHEGIFENLQQKQEALAIYLGLISFMDAQVGRVLDALTQSDHASNTLVVYSSDHGDNHGARGLWGKSVLYRESTQIPMLMAGPGVPVGECRTNVGLIDIGATVVEALGHPRKPHGSGESLIAIANSPDDDQRVGFSEYHAVGSPSAGFMVVKGRYKYHHYVGYEPELFDLDRDPEELEDLSMRPDHAQTVTAMLAVLMGMLNPDHVDARAKADQNLLVERHGGAEVAFNLGTPGATPVSAH